MIYTDLVHCFKHVSFYRLLRQWRLCLLLHLYNKILKLILFISPNNSQNMIRYIFFCDLSYKIIHISIWHHTDSIISDLFFLFLIKMNTFYIRNISYLILNVYIYIYMLTIFFYKLFFQAEVTSSLFLTKFVSWSYLKTILHYDLKFGT